MVEENPEFEDKPSAICRRRTQVAVVNLSWWDCIKGFFCGPSKVIPKLAVTVEIADLENVDEKVSALGSTLLESEG